MSSFINRIFKRIFESIKPTRKGKLGGFEMERGIIRQGDVLLVPVELDRPENAIQSGEVILAEGEMTGHAHRVQADIIYEWESEGQRYIRVAGTERGKLKHEDHDPTAVAVIEPATTYRVVPQQEWDVSGQWRRVID